MENKSKYSFTKFGEIAMMICAVNKLTYSAMAKKMGISSITFSKLCKGTAPLTLKYYQKFIANFGGFITTALLADLRDTIVNGSEPKNKVTKVKIRLHKPTRQQTVFANFYAKILMVYATDVFLSEIQEYCLKRLQDMKCLPEEVEAMLKIGE